MKNFIRSTQSEHVEEYSKGLGYSKTLFEKKDFIFVDAKSKKELLRAITKAKAKRLLTVYRPTSEDMLRFALEKTPLDIVLGVEGIHRKDSVHFLRGGLDQVLCRIAAKQGKIIAFAFNDILHARDRSRLLARMQFNIKLCKKFKVKTLYSTFVKDKKDLRSVNDLKSLFRILQ